MAKYKGGNRESVEAVKWTGDNFDELAGLMEGQKRREPKKHARVVMQHSAAVLRFPHMDRVIPRGSYLLRDKMEVFSICHADVFERMYRRVD